MISTVVNVTRDTSRLLTGRHPCTCSDHGPPVSAGIAQKHNVVSHINLPYSSCVAGDMIVAEALEVILAGPPLVIENDPEAEVLTLPALKLALADACCVRLVVLTATV